MMSYVLGRLMATIPVMAIVAITIFSLLYFSPGDPAHVLAGEAASADDIERIRQTLGLERPFFERFGEWSLGVLRGDFGNSIFFGRPVADLILQRAGPSIVLSVASLVLAVTLAIPLGVIAALRAGRLADRIAMGFAVLGFSLPVFVLGYLLIFFFSVRMRWLPVQGYVSPSDGIWPFLSHLILPSLALGIVYAALIARTTRAAMLEVLGQDYMRTARAKGLGLARIVVRHALKNAAIPIVTVIGIGFGVLISGVVVTETVFNIPGIGRLTVDAILRRDYPVIQGIVLVFSATYVLINLVVDLSYALFDPRIRY
jgi:peptide/nickel transport system permease protein